MTGLIVLAIILFFLWLFYSFNWYKIFKGKKCRYFVSYQWYKNKDENKIPSSGSGMCVITRYSPISTYEDVTSIKKSLDEDHENTIIINYKRLKK